MPELYEDEFGWVLLAPDDTVPLVRQQLAERTQPVELTLELSDE